MRTLKKTLALVLVLAMMFSLCITASADFVDQEDIQNELAVNVLYELGIIEGMPDGTFDPAGTLTRAQAAKILCYMLGVGDYAKDGAETEFSDVPASHWASGYIAFCADQGIIDGYGDGKFGPSDALTGYAWAKMLLVAFDLVEYTWNGETYAPISLTGASWQILTAKYATAAGLWLDDTTSKKEAVTRDNACLHAFNVVKDELIANGKADEVKYPALIYTEAVPNEFGAPVADVWTLAVDAEKEPVVVYSEGYELIAEYTDGVKVSKIIEDLDLEEDEVVTLQRVVNGVEKLAFKSDAKYTDHEAAAGTLVQVYEAKDTIKIIWIETSVATLTKDNLTEDGLKIDGMEFETEEEYAEGDVVLYVVAVDEIFSVEKAPVVEGVINVVADDASTFEMDGTTYTVRATNLIETLAVSEKTMLVYTDKYGYVVEVEAKPAEEETPDEPAEPEYVYGYLVNYKQQDYEPAVEADFWDDSVIPTEGKVAYEKFLLVDANGDTVTLDGAVEVVENEDGSYTTKPVKGEDVTAGLVKYAVEDGLVTAIAGYDNALERSYKAGDATLKNAKGNYGTHMLAPETLFFYVYNTEDGQVVEVKTFADAASFDLTTVEFFKDNETKTLPAIAAYADPNPEQQPEPTPDPEYEDVLVYFGDTSYKTVLASKEVEKDGEVETVYYKDYVYAGAYVGAEPTTIKVEDEQLAGLEGAGFYTVTICIDTGYATAAVAVDTIEADVAAVQPTYFKAGGEYYYITDATNYYVVADGAVAAAEGISASTEETLVTVILVVAETEIDAETELEVDTGKEAAVYYILTDLTEDAE